MLTPNIENTEKRFNRLIIKMQKTPPEKLKRMPDTPENNNPDNTTRTDINRNVLLLFILYNKKMVMILASPIFTPGTATMIGISVSK